MNLHRLNLEDLSGLNQDKPIGFAQVIEYLIQFAYVLEDNDDDNDDDNWKLQKLNRNLSLLVLRAD